MHTASGRAYQVIPREQALAECYRAALRARGCAIAATEEVAEYAKRLDALEQARAS